MNDAMHITIGRKCAARGIALALTFCWLAATDSLGQQSQPTARELDSAKPEMRRHGREKRGERSEAYHGDQMGRLPGARLLRPQPEDEGPLSDSEREALLTFVKKNAPEMFDALRKLKQIKPQEYEEQFQNAAPHLRRLQRIYQRNPELGESIVRHSQNLRKIRGMRHAWRDSANNPPARQRIEELMRQLVAENAEIENAVMDDQIRELEFQRDARIKAEFNRLATTDADLTAEPQRVRELAGRLREHPPQAEQEWLEDELWLICAQRMDTEVNEARRHLDQMREELQKEVDRRMERLTRERDDSRQPNSPPPDGPPPQPRKDDH